MHHLLSAGIDLGSSTTKFVFSRLAIEQVLLPGSLPASCIVQREVLHQSPLYRTPMGHRHEIDMAAVSQLLQEAFNQSGIAAHQLASGAVIITGETATAVNAQAATRSLATQAGEFVVATAGPDLEGIFAARGSGAADLARQTGTTVANVDIGGGTANIAVFQSERLIGTATLAIGGRIIEWDPHSQAITRISPLFAPMGDPALIIRHAADALVRCLSDEWLEADRPLYLGPPPRWGLPFDTILFSGGVAACHQEPDGLFHDAGRALMAQLLAHPALAGQDVRISPAGSRATVLGAGLHATTLSGATVYNQGFALPRRNLAIATWSLQALDQGVASLQAALRPLADHPDGVALFLSDWPPRLGFGQLSRLADMLSQVNDWHVLILAKDLAMALGQTLAAKAPDRPFLCLDGLSPGPCDYIDVGSPLPGTDAVPVVIKTLAFSSPQTERHLP